MSKWVICIAKQVFPFAVYWVQLTRWGRDKMAAISQNTLKRIFLTENVSISIKISLKFVRKGSVNNIAALFQIMAWRLPEDKPLSEPMVASLPTHICVTWPQWVKKILNGVIFHKHICQVWINVSIHQVMGHLCILTWWWDKRKWMLYSVSTSISFSAKPFS